MKQRITIDWDDLEMALTMNVEESPCYLNAESVDDAELRGKLEVALDGRGAFRRFKNVLADHRAERERWFAFHGRRPREAMDEWLTDHDIEPTTTPPR